MAHTVNVNVLDISVTKLDFDALLYVSVEHLIRRKTHCQCFLQNICPIDLLNLIPSGFRIKSC